MMTLRKMVAEVIKDQKQITDCLSPQVIAKAKRCEELERYLSNVKVKVKAAVTVDTPYGKAVKVVYEIAPETILIDDDGNVSCSDSFSSMNALNIVGLDDMNRIQFEIQKAINNK